MARIVAVVEIVGALVLVAACLLFVGFAGLVVVRLYRG
jgi:hypothetical protein